MSEGFDYEQHLNTKCVELQTVNEKGEHCVALITPIEKAVLDGLLDAYKERAYEDQFQVFIEEDEAEATEQRKETAEREAESREHNE